MTALLFFALAAICTAFGWLFLLLGSGWGAIAMGLAVLCFGAGIVWALRDREGWR